MADRFVHSHIRQLPLFAKIPPEQFNPIVEAFQVQRYEPGEYIFRQGDPTQGMYLFVSGRGQIVQTDPQGQMQVIGFVQQNQYLNEIALFHPGTETASLYVIETTTVLFLARNRLLSVVEYYPEIKDYLPIPDDAVRTRTREKVFSNQRDNEEVLLNSRRHWFALIRRSWWGLLLAIGLVAVSTFIQFSALVAVLDLLAVLLAGTFLVYNYLEWRNDRVIVTDQRVIRIEREILTFKTSISEVPLNSIHEINADNITADPFSRLLNYGTVHIKTAGNAGNMELTVMGDPDGIQDLIFDSRKRHQEYQQSENRSAIRATVDKAIGRQSDQPANPPGQKKPEQASQSRNRPLLPTRFINDEGEITYRRHTNYWLRRTFIPLMGILVGLGIIFVGFSAGLGVIGPIFGFFLMLLFAVWLYFADWDWRNDLYIIGDTTLQLIHRRPFWLQNETDEVLLQSVDNVVSEQNGIMQSLLGYGDVRISLIGGDKADAKVFRGVPKPRQVSAEITGRQVRNRDQAKAAAERQRREEIAEYLAVYHETVGNDNNQNPPPNTNQPYNQGRTVRDRMRPPKVPRQRS